MPRVRRSSYRAVATVAMIPLAAIDCGAFDDNVQLSNEYEHDVIVNVTSYPPQVVEVESSIYVSLQGVGCVEVVVVDERSGTELERYDSICEAGRYNLGRG